LQVVASGWKELHSIASGCKLLHTANRKHPYTSRTLANGQSVREEYGRSEECKGGVREILLIV
jgi:hypothetical protein